MPKKSPSPIRIDGDTAYVQLTKGFEAAIDISDVAEISKHHWSLLTTPSGHKYAYRCEAHRLVMMHRWLLSVPTGMVTDHEDNDGLNNRRKNIRAATSGQNMANRAMERRNLVGKKGVSKKGNAYVATITSDGKKINLGRYPTENEASAAYLGAARVLWGPFART